MDKMEIREYLGSEFGDQRAVLDFINAELSRLTDLLAKNAGLFHVFKFNRLLKLHDHFYALWEIEGAKLDRILDRIELEQENWSNAD